MKEQFVEQSYANPQRKGENPCAEWATFIEAGLQGGQSGDADLFVGITQQLAHDIRNVLGCMNGFITLLRRDLEQNPDCLHLLQKIRKGSDRLEQIVNDLALFSQQQPMYLAESDLDKAMEQAIRFCRANIKEHFRDIEIQWTPTGDRLHVFVNIDLFSRLLYMAVVTLIKNMVNGSEITVNTRVQKAESVVQIRLTAYDYSENSSRYSLENRAHDWQNQRPFNNIVICKILQMLNGKPGQVVLHGHELCIDFSLPHVTNL